MISKVKRVKVCLRARESKGSSVYTRKNTDTHTPTRTKCIPTGGNLPGVVRNALESISMWLTFDSHVREKFLL